MCRTRLVPPNPCNSPSSLHDLEFIQSDTEPNHLKCTLCGERFFVIGESQLNKLGMEVRKTVKQSNN